MKMENYVYNSYNNRGIELPGGATGICFIQTSYVFVMFIIIFLSYFYFHHKTFIIYT